MKSKRQPTRTPQEPEVITVGDHLQIEAKKAEQTVISKAPPKEKKPNKKDSEIVQLRREIKALRAHQAEERKLAGEVEAAELDLEGANAERTAARERLAEANKKLATFVRGEPARDVETGKQQELLPEKPKGAQPGPLVDPTRDGAAAFKAGKPLSVNPWGEKDAQRGLWAAGYLGAKWAKVETRKAINYALTFPALLEAAISDDFLPAGEKAPPVKPVVAMGYNWLVVDAWKTGEKTASFALVQLLTKDEWKDLWQKTYGPPIPGVDKSDEHKAQRQLGGIDCGRIVSVGKKLYVVGPTSAAMVLTVAESDKPPKAAPVDGKARAANDRDDADDQDEDGQDD